MTIQNVIDWFGTHQNMILIYFGGLIVLTLLVLAVLNAKNSKNLRYVMSLLVYGVSIPGILALILVLYGFFIQNSNMLNVNVIAYFVPVASMCLVLFLLNRKVHMKDIPGFGKLSSLMVLIGVSFAIVFVLQRMHFGIFFIGGFGQLLLVFGVVLLILKIAWSRLTRKK